VGCKIEMSTFENCVLTTELNIPHDRGKCMVSSIDVTYYMGTAHHFPLYVFFAQSTESDCIIDKWREMPV
jgi:hypothetical protein